jgi:hypothetical protein
MLRVSLFVLLLLAAAPANLFTNGDFEQPLDVGWKQAVENAAGLFSFDRSDTLGQPTPGYAACVYKYLAYYASLSQDVAVPGADLEFKMDARLRMAGGSSTCWPAGAVVVSYLNAGDRELGSTMYILRNEYCDWVESDTLHFIDINEPGEWRSYSLKVAEEIAAYLPGVNRPDVAKLKVQLFSYVNGT